MLIETAAEIPLRSKSLPGALREFRTFVQEHFAIGKNAEASLGISETGWRANELIAQSLPENTKAFYPQGLIAGAGITAGEFLEAARPKKLKKTGSSVRVEGVAAQNLFELLEGLAAALPKSGRGILLMYHLTGLRFVGGGVHASVSASFSRYAHGANVISASVGLAFHALSLKDPRVEETIAEASRRTKFSFSKPTSRLASAAETTATVLKDAATDARLQPPTPEALLVVLKCFDEALARAADRIGARTEDLLSIPLLFGRSAGFNKRIKDVMAKKRESISLLASVKKFMKERFPDYRFDSADPEELWFRKTVAPTLDLLVMFDKVHFHGLGKAFGLNFAADFPNTSFGGLHTGLGGTRKSVFAMFHQGWEQQLWAYTTSQELATAIEGCAGLLGRVLPALEDQCRQLLIPTPASLPPGIEARGALSAREAFAEVLPLARKWATDAELLSVYTTNLIFIRDRSQSAHPAAGNDGRLLPEGSWGFAFVSRGLDQLCNYDVPSIGRVRWNFYPGSISVPKYGPALDIDDWVDSTLVAQRAFEAIREQLGDFRIFDVFLKLHERSRGKGDFVWEACCIAFGSSMRERRDITVQLDRRTGQVLDISTR